jgi:hypothetical protein
MRIVARDKNGEETEAIRVDGMYRCYPKSTNTKEHAVEFERIEDAAVFLILKPDWGIRMKSGSPIKYRDIRIVRDE